MRYRAAALLLILVLVSVSCGGGGTQADGGDATEDAAAEDGAIVAVASTDLGDVLADGDGATLYAFLNDEQGASVCYDDCEQNWPPLPGPAQAGEGTDQSLLATVERDDGTSQATYNDWPLYYFAGDAAPGDTAGQGVGEVWFVVDASGEPVKDAANKPGQY